MTKLEYADYYRFVVSVGVALVVLAVLFPWLVLREGFDVAVSQQQLEALTEVGRQVVASRQRHASWLVTAWPWISLALAAIGALLVFCGLKNWRKRQEAVDEEQKLRTEKLRRELEEMSPQEVEEKIRTEVSLLEFDPDMIEPPVSANRVAEYRAAEEAVGDAFERCLGGEHNVLRNRRIGVAQYDLVVQHPDRKGRDLVVEVKYIAKNFHFGWLSEAARRLATSAQVYGGLLMGPANGLLVVVLPPSLANQPRLKGYIDRLERDLGSTEIILRVTYVSSTYLEKLDCPKVEGWVQGLLEKVV